MNKPFHDKRRQQFLTEAYFKDYATYLAKERDYWQEALTGVGDSEDEQRMLARLTHSNFSYVLFSIQYTAGEPIEQLRTELTAVIEAYERYQKSLEAYENVPEVAPLGLGRIEDYERCMQLIGLCYLMHRRDLIPRITKLQDPAYAGEDAFYEDFLSYEIEGRYDTDKMLHLDLYDPLLHSMYAETNERSIKDIQTYLKKWYPAFKYAPWHDGHLRINGTDGDYFGYWAFEAGAVVYLLDLDDTAIDHLVYPKDLVTWARANKHLAQEAPDASHTSRCEAGQPCPQTGYWFTPAQANSRRHFKAGEIMPTVGADYGTTIWQWDSDNRPIRSQNK